MLKGWVYFHLFLAVVGYIIDRVRAISVSHEETAHAPFQELSLSSRNKWMRAMIVYKRGLDYSALQLV